LENVTSAHKTACAFDYHAKLLHFECVLHFADIISVEGPEVSADWES